MVVFKGIEVKVRVNGQDAVEYDDPEPKGNTPLAQKTVIKYIESIDDAEFQFNCAVLPDFVFDTVGFAYWVSINGKRVCAQISLPEFRHTPRTLKGETTSTYGGGSQLNHFKFSSLKVVESADSSKIKDDIKNSENLGELRVEIQRFKKIEYSRNNQRNRASRMENKPTEISEKALKGKALSHGVSTGRVTPIRNTGTSILDYVDTKEDPALRFIFRYRSKAALISEMVIPREASPDAEGNGDDGRDVVNGLSVEELRRIAREHLNASQQPVAKEEPEVKAERGVKRERIRDPPATIDLEAPKPKLRKTSMARPIDLTSDSE